MQVQEGCQTLYVRGGSSRQDKRDANAQDLGELLAAECLSRSGVCDAATAQYFCGRSLDLLKRKWLRELAARVFAGLIHKVDDAKGASTSDGRLTRERPGRRFAGVGFISEAARRGPPI